MESGYLYGKILRMTVLRSTRMLFMLLCLELPWLGKMHREEQAHTSNFPRSTPVSTILPRSAVEHGTLLLWSIFPAWEVYRSCLIHTHQLHSSEWMLYLQSAASFSSEKLSKIKALKISTYCIIPIVKKILQTSASEKGVSMCSYYSFFVTLLVIQIMM